MVIGRARCNGVDVQAAEVLIDTGPDVVQVLLPGLVRDLLGVGCDLAAVAGVSICNLQQLQPYLRKKLEEVGNKDYIETVWGIGFKLTEQKS